jgi:hypothetical protein
VRITALSVAVALTLAGCVTSDHEYGEAVRDLMAQGPKAACCTAPWTHSTAAADRARCEAEAITRCVFALDATVRVERVDRFGHDDGAMVEVEVVGSAGRGSCHYQVLNRRRAGLLVEGGSCAAY